MKQITHLPDIHYQKNNVYMILFLVILATSCKQVKKSEKETDMEMHQQAMSETYVDTMTLRTSVFDKQIVCNGRLRAKAKSELNFVTQGVTTNIFVKDINSHSPKNFAFALYLRWFILLFKIYY